MRCAPLLLALAVVVTACLGCKDGPPPQPVGFGDEWNQQADRWDAEALTGRDAPAEPRRATWGEQASYHIIRTRADVPDAAISLATDAGESWFSKWVASRYGAGVGGLLTVVLAFLKARK